MEDERYDERSMSTYDLDLEAGLLQICVTVRAASDRQGMDVVIQF